jgi:hypothetical protein
VPFLLAPDALAHQSVAYRTSASSDAPGCLRIGWISAIANADLKHPILFTGKSLLKPACSAVDAVGYRRGPGDVTDFYESPIPGERQLTLIAGHPIYSTYVWIPFRTDPQAATTGDERVLLLSARSPEGDTRVDEVRPFPVGHSGAPAGDAESGLAGIEAFGAPPGENTFQLFQADRTTADGELHFLRSVPLTVLITDPATIARNWGATQEGVRVDLTLDKTDFRLGEDIAVHIAAEVVESSQAVYGEPYRPDGAFFHTITGGFQLRMWDDDGPLENTDHQANLYRFPDGSSGPVACTPSLEVGKVIPLDIWLRNLGLLPTRSGTYQLQVTWSPYHSRFAACPNVWPDPPEQPFVTVMSNPVTIAVTGTPSATPLPAVPDFTAWTAHFHLVETAFGPGTALLDLATGFEWLRPSFTAASATPTDAKRMAARMGLERELDGWRFATLDEVREFLAHFTGTPDGRSNDPAVVRKLLRLLGGGPLNTTPDRQTGWIDNRLSVRIAPDERIGGGERYAFFAEAVKDGQGSARVVPDEAGAAFWNTGFFLVRRQNKP